MACAVPDGRYLHRYIVFIAIVFISSAAALFLANPSPVTRGDGTPVQIERISSWSSELRALGKLLKQKDVLLMMPAFIASNWYYAFFFSMNAHYFSLRGRSLNAALYWTVEPMGFFLMSGILDFKRVKRRTRGLVGLATLAVCACAIWIEPNHRQKWTGGKVVADGQRVLFCTYRMVSSTFRRRNVLHILLLDYWYSNK